MENFDWLQIISIGLGLIATIAGAFWLKAKGKIAQIVVLGRELVDVIDAFEKALADNKVDKAEVDNLKVQVNEVKAAFKALIGKE